MAARERLLALEMVQDRDERESAVRPATAGSLGPLAATRPASAPAAPKKHARNKKHAIPEDGRDFITAVPRATK